MRIARLLAENIENAGSVVSIEEQLQLRHLVKVLRASEGDTVELFDGKGNCATAVIEQITKQNAVLKITDVKKNSPRINKRIIIAASCAKQQRFEEIIAKCTELGIDKIVPVIYQRTVKQPKNKNVRQRYEHIAVESAKQCKTNFLPEITEPQKFDDVLKNLNSEFPNAKIIFGSTTENCKSIVDVSADNDIVVFIGAEGGFEPEEENTLKNTANATAVKMTDTVLRIETAAITAAAVLGCKRDMGK